MRVEFHTFGIHLVGRMSMFKRRLGKNMCEGGRYCPQVLEKEDGNFAVCGPLITEEAVKAMPPGPGVGPNEGVVEVPRSVMLAAAADLIAAAAVA